MCFKKSTQTSVIKNLKLVGTALKQAAEMKHELSAWILIILAGYTVQLK